MRFLSALLATFMITALYIQQSEAKRHDTTISGPGFSVSQKEGWFGKKETQYSDILGNRYNHHNSWLSKDTTEGNVFGTQFKQQGENNVSVTSPGGRPIVESKDSFLGGSSTHVDLNALNFQAILDSLSF